MDLRYIDIDIQPIFDEKPALSDADLYFLGPTNGSSKIREEVRKLSLAKFKDSLGDIGDLTSAGSPQIDAILSELENNYGQIVTCLSPKTSAIYRSEWMKRYQNPAMVHNGPSVEFNEFACIGIQNHLLDDEFVIDPRIHCRLGAINQDIEKAEVILRSADLVWVDLNVLRLSDNLGSAQSSTAGLSTEQFCTIAKYIGASTQLKSVIITGYDENSDPFGMAAKNLALFLYYLLEGTQIRRKESLWTEDFVKYSVVHDSASSELVFMEDQRSGRWWVQMYSIDAQQEVKIPCTRLDYEEACNNRISDRLTSLFALV